MKVPRNISGERLVGVLRRHGYQIIRQKGSHIRMRNEGPPAHSITVPNHSPLKTGTLHAILSELVERKVATLPELLNELS